mmetsp:Transcript_18549/g.71600  ORF Transcript_18549/g.71600 Transcript_18549/m.71600 type:complete len:240 (+) Transcript_18549:63-782(+)
MRKLVLLQGELSVKVVTEVRDSLNGGEELGIEGLLVAHALGGDHVSLLGLLVEELARLALVLGRLEVGVVELGRNLNLRNIDLGGGGDHVGLVHTTNGHSVNLEGASDEEKSGSELPQENNTLATEAACEEDEHGARGDGTTKASGRRGEGPAHRRLDVLSGVEAGTLLSDGPLATAEVLGHDSLAVLLLLHSLPLVGLLRPRTTLLDHGRARVDTHAASQWLVAAALRVTRHDAPPTA